MAVTRVNSLLFRGWLSVLVVTYNYLAIAKFMLFIFYNDNTLLTLCDDIQQVESECNRFIIRRGS